MLNRIIRYFNKNPELYPDNNKNWYMIIEEELNEFQDFYNQWFIHKKEGYKNKKVNFQEIIRLIEKKPSLLKNKFTKNWFMYLKNYIDSPKGNF